MFAYNDDNHVFVAIKIVNIRWKEDGQEDGRNRQSPTPTYRTDPMSSPLRTFAFLNFRFYRDYV